jgi:hypothetical protein
MLAYHSFIEEPKDSEAPTTKCRFIVANMSHCFDHTDNRCCGCSLLDPAAEKPEPCTCGPDECCSECPEPECQHPNSYNYGLASGPPVIRYFYCPDCRAKWEAEEAPEEPPLTPEEEEQAPEDEAPAPCHECNSTADSWYDRSICAEPCGSSHNRCSDCGAAVGGCPNEVTQAAVMRDPDAPPQPDRRPPNLIAYSVQGHLYEVALPGDATVRAVDGVLVIQHHLGPVAAICQVRPIVNEESNG